MKGKGEICKVRESKYGFEIGFLVPVEKYSFRNKQNKEERGDIYVLNGKIVAVDTPTVMLLPSTGCMMAVEEIKDPLLNSPVIVALRDRYDGGDKMQITLKDLPSCGYVPVPGMDPDSRGKLASRLIGRNLEEVGEEFELKFLQKLK